MACTPFTDIAVEHGYRKKWEDIFCLCRIQFVDCKAIICFSLHIHEVYQNHLIWWLNCILGCGLVALNLKQNTAKCLTEKNTEGSVGECV